MRYLIEILMFLVVVSPAFAEPILWDSGDGGNGHFYETVSFTDTFLSWAESRDEASSMNWLGAQGHLATMNSEEENAWVWANLDQPYTYYLGGFQAIGSAEPASGWQWITAEPWSFTNWEIGEPNNASSGPSGVEDCLQFNGISGVPGSWNDADILNISEGGALGFIVEYEVAPVDDECISWGRVKALYR